MQWCSNEWCSNVAEEGSDLCRGCGIERDHEANMALASATFTTQVARALNAIAQVELAAAELVAGHVEHEGSDYLYWLTGARRRLAAVQAIHDQNQVAARPPSGGERRG